MNGYYMAYFVIGDAIKKKGGGEGDGRNGTFLCQLYLQYLASEVSIWIYHVFSKTEMQMDLFLSRLIESLLMIKSNNLI